MTVAETDILLVEDNEDDVYFIQRALKHQRPLNEVVVRDGVEALDFLFARGAYATRDPNRLPQVVFLDINLPKLSGLEVLKSLRGEERTKFLPVVMLTSSREERDIIDSYNNKANSYVQKPICSAEFTNAVEQLGTYWLNLNERMLP